MIRGEEFEFVFRVEEFSMAPQKPGEPLKSPMVETFDGARWQLEVHPRGTGASEGYVSCFLCRAKEDAGPEEVSLGFSLELVASDASIQETHSIASKSMKRGSNWGYGKFVKRDSLFRVGALLLPEDTLSIQCRMVRHWPKDVDKQDLFVRTRVGCKSMQFSWEIRNVSKSTKDDKRRHVVRQGRPEFTIALHEEDGTLKFEISLMDAPEATSVVASCRIAVADVDGRATDWEKEEFHAFANGTEVWQFPSFLTRKELEEKGYLVDDMLCLCCSMEKSTGGSSETWLEKSVYGDATRDLVDLGTVLNHDMRKLLDGDRYHDVKLLSGGESVLAHQFVLHARSPVLRDVLLDERNRWSGEGLLELDVSLVDMPTLKRMLTYMYSEYMDSNLSLADLIKLFAAGKDYEVIALKERCSKKLRTSIAIGTVCQVLGAASQHGDYGLEEAAVDFMAEYWSEMSLSEEWEDFVRTHGDLSADARRRIRAKRLKE